MGSTDFTCDRHPILTKRSLLIGIHFEDSRNEFLFASFELWCVLNYTNLEIRNPTSAESPMKVAHRSRRPKPISNLRLDASEWQPLVLYLKAKVCR